MTHLISTALRETFRSRAGVPVVRDGDRQWCGDEINSVVAARARHFGLQGIRPAQTVLVTGGRGFEYWLDVMALWQLGAVPAPLDPGAGVQLCTHITALIHPVAVIGAESLAEPARESLDGWIAANPGRPAPRDVALILFTSGTTGLPKAVPLSARAIHDNARATIHATGLARCKQLFAPVPFRFVSGLSHYVATVLAGVLFHGSERKYPQGELVEAYAQCGADAFGGSPIQARWLAESADTPPVRWLMSSGDHLAVDIISTLTARFPGIQVVTAYGLTELAGRFCILDPAAVGERAGSVGHAIDGLAVAIDGGDESSGHVVAFGDLVFDGYLAADGSRFGLDESGRFDTGDIGHLDEAGYLYLTGRADDVFKSGGLKVSTQPIAEALMQQGMFRDVAVVSIDHDVLGLVPGVVYSLLEGAEFKKGPVIRALRQSLASSHLPQKFVEVEQIERTGSGKVVRQAARTLLEEADK